MWPRCSWAWYIPTGCGTAAFRRRRAVPEATQLSRLFGLRVTSAFVIALAVGLLVYYFLFYTSMGFQLRPWA